MTQQERKQIDYLKKQKDELIDRFIGACEQINDLIDEVRSGVWAREMEKGANNG
jgi:hypothetical protein